MDGKGAGGWRVAAAGECMLSRTFMHHDEPDFLKIKEIMDAADVCYSHLEMNLGDFTAAPARGDWIGSYMMADPALAAELHELGIDMMSTANNHSFDYGEKGILDTRRYCLEAGLAAAGTGRDLDEAREPAYWEGSAGRAALVSATTGNGAYEWANMAKGSMPARAGVNPLRVKVRYSVPHEEAGQLRAIGKRLGIFREAGSKVEGNTPVGLEPGEFRLFLASDQSQKGSCVYIEGEDFGIRSSCNKTDLEGSLRSIREARHMSDFVMAAHHFNLSEGPRGDVPPSFAVEYAHAAIDAGADVYFGHGWHKTLGIEIYKGRPIFYGLGNFFAQSQFIRKVPYDSYETWGHDVDRLLTLRPSDEPLHPGMDRVQATWWSSALIDMEFGANRNIREISFYPVELGRDVSAEAPITRRTGKYAEGRPMLAHGENARRIIERLQRLSAPYGTEITMDGDIGRWTAPESSAEKN